MSKKLATLLGTLTVFAHSCTINTDNRHEVEAPVTTSSPMPTLLLPQQELPPEDPALVRALVGQLMMVGVNDFDDALFALRQGVGGIFIRSDSNPELLITPGRDLATLRRLIGRPFAVGIDFEGGRVLRHREILGDFPSPRDMADTLSPDQVRGLAFEMGTILNQHGITVNFAPVIDVDGDGLAVVGDRAFSHDPLRSSLYATAFALGMRDAGVIPVFKHFPGHGRATGDSHHETVRTPPLDELMTRDLLPYGAIADIPDAAVMVGHMVVPGLGELPASLSPQAYELLRRGHYPGGSPFSGIIFTDDLSGMRAISDQLSIPEAVGLALSAGADQALWISTAELPAVIDQVTADYGTENIAELRTRAERVAALQR
ncbi:glycoside hydrolase family 3 protein [Corynebacterium sp. ES2794-CONJ1]|uniref:glycoside hydrolase family 3 N-terminal domain-containing protein n=1 Tax=unclassified Corynebacterium TaxID=2624378 RepID=UPI0021686FBC|nr:MULTISPECIES: glycoside hydrolase family 3 N-terminal domain-containing protein [unclassified Corynebacterium]MCS4490161.1 glycoside hydrolase family 3 protein [Corynebacterium sp. ES2775-CONJ]MCS4492027.1 glycoside hydrolase family 3 protein [Corynebacterium sp. ES2715-CONJ3]MCS4532132.1 glycoside hydrolase family 3 protein [Corynebacterium sp. ES2730-CONJ]MCU9519534.1 glycoside hydrolase family 3 protein [Corynebacterium sp. ES2794-CONJ1]